jgi:hypothetical protein
MLPCCILPKLIKNPIKSKKGSFFHFFDESNPEIICFEQFCLERFSHLQTDTKKILDEYNQYISFPPNIQKQIMRECEEILQSRGYIEKLKSTQKYWKECQKMQYFASLTVKWIKENKNPKFEKWLIKMLKIFILGMLPNIEKRKKGEELYKLIYSQFYDVYHYRDVYQDFTI